MVLTGKLLETGHCGQWEKCGWEPWMWVAECRSSGPPPPGAPSLSPAQTMIDSQCREMVEVLSGVLSRMCIWKACCDATM